jgi:FkbM family methyltransferase
MRDSPHKIGFIVASTDHGTLILNRFDFHMANRTQGYGVGFEILERGAFQAGEIESVLVLLDLRRKHFGDGVVVIDCGANIGTHTIEWSRRMIGWGSVIAIEAQERIFYALAGNIAINNCFNARAVHAAVAGKDGFMTIPIPNYLAPGSFGSLELRQREKAEFIGQQIAYTGSNLTTVRTLALDSLNLPRIDLIKIDVEGMELEVLEGASASIQKAKPILLVEMIKVDEPALRLKLEQLGYQIFKMGPNFLAVHSTDQIAQAWSQGSECGRRHVLTASECNTLS